MSSVPPGAETSASAWGRIFGRLTRSAGDYGRAFRETYGHLAWAMRSGRLSGLGVWKIAAETLSDVPFVWIDRAFDPLFRIPVAGVELLGRGLEALYARRGAGKVPRVVRWMSSLGGALGGAGHFTPRATPSPSTNPFKFPSPTAALEAENFTVERILRKLLAGGSWFPHWNNPVHPELRYAPSTAIARRLLYAGAIAGAFSGLSELVSPKAPPPQVFFDGVSMRHINDMGADLRYAERMRRR